MRLKPERRPNLVNKMSFIKAVILRITPSLAKVPCIKTSWELLFFSKFILSIAYEMLLSITDTDGYKLGCYCFPFGSRHHLELIYQFGAENQSPPVHLWEQHAELLEIKRFVFPLKSRFLLCLQMQIAVLQIKR